MHTPGPWVVWVDPDGCYVGPEEGTAVADVASQDDAPLIAAAPALLAALELMVQCFGHQRMIDEADDETAAESAIQDARAAITDAQGK